MERALKVGDWVYYDGDNKGLVGSVGYVKTVGLSSCMIQFVRGPYIKNRLELRIPNYNLMKPKVDAITKEDYEFLMELALSLRDFEWCKELADRRG